MDCHARADGRDYDPFHEAPQETIGVAPFDVLNEAADARAEGLSRDRYLIGCRAHLDHTTIDIAVLWRRFA
jgi:hypothetical protein